MINLMSEDTTQPQGVRARFTFGNKWAVSLVEYPFIPPEIAVLSPSGKLVDGPFQVMRVSGEDGADVFAVVSYWVASLQQPDWTPSIAKLWMTAAQDNRVDHLLKSLP